MIHRAILCARIPLALVAGACLFGEPASAQVIEMIARIDGAQETPPVPSLGSGIGVFSVDTQTGVVDYRITFQGLGSAETLAHVHGFAPPGTPAGILFTLPPGALKCGTFTLAPNQQASFLAGLTYVNIHSANFGGGEIRGQISEVESMPTFCYGDWTGIECPCLNTSAVGANEGCLHSLGTGGRLVGYGNPSLSNDNVVLHYLRGPTVSPVLFFQGTTKVGAGAGAQFGDGLRCVGGAVVRLGTRTPCQGMMTLPDTGEPDLSAMGQFATPGSRFYQAWYRNAATFCTAATFNLTNGVEVAWVP